MPETQIIVDTGPLVAFLVKGERHHEWTKERIVGWYKQGLNAEEIAREIGHLTAGQVYAALAYYHANTEEIERLLAEELADHDRLCAEFSQNQPKGE